CSTLRSYLNLHSFPTRRSSDLYISMDYQNQGGLFNEDPASSYITNVDYSRYVLRTNLELNVDKNMTAYLQMVGNIQDFLQPGVGDRKSTRLNSSHVKISYAVFC